MEFWAFHGCLPEERRDGNRFSVDVCFNYDMTEAAKTDNLSAAVDYSAVYEIVKAQMEIPSNLLENVSYRISEAISAAFPMITALTVTVTKFNPPVSGKAGSSSVTTIKC